MATKVKAQDVLVRGSKYSNEEKLICYFELRAVRKLYEKQEKAMEKIAVDILEKNGGKFSGKAADFALETKISHPLSWSKALNGIRERLSKKMQAMYDEVVEANTGTSTKKTPKMITK